MSAELKTSNEWNAFTYPCYFARNGDRLSILKSGSDTCFVFLSDRDIVERYFRGMHPDQETVTIQVFTMPDRDELLRILPQVEEDGLLRGVTHIAIDPTENRVGVVPIREFIEEAQQQTREIK